MSLGWLCCCRKKKQNPDSKNTQSVSDNDHNSPDKNSFSNIDNGHKYDDPRASSKDYKHRSRDAMQHEGRVGGSNGNFDLEANQRTSKIFPADEKKFDESQHDRHHSKSKRNVQEEQQNSNPTDAQKQQKKRARKPPRRHEIEVNKNIIAESVEDAARGCILGAFIGDAAGAVLEFYHKQITQKVVNRALTFPGGGSLAVEPGQFTDDSEMAMCLMHGLIEGKGAIDQAIIGKWYLEWYRSPPFDIGNTTATAMR